MGGPYHFFPPNSKPDGLMFDFITIIPLIKTIMYCSPAFSEFGIVIVKFEVFELLYIPY